ncbi:MAG: type II CAAX endopeptidase family protein [bacterium]|nr:type II CAAX endopeptidase family protein [bacterium]
MKYEKKQFTKYIVFSFVFAWILQIIASVFAINGNVVAFKLILAVVMFIPLLAVICARIPLKGLGWKPRVKGKVKYIILGILIPAALTVTGALLFFLVFPKSFDMTGEMLRLQAGEEALKIMEAQGITVPMYLIIATVQCLTIAPFINMFTAIGEEAGWRGVMYPMLKDKFGVTKGRILGGVSWGIWHWPIIALAGYEYNVSIFDNPIKSVLGMLLFCVFATCMGIFIDELYEKTNIIWVPALAHGAINAMATIPIYMLKESYADKMMIGPATIGILSGIPLIILAIWICRKTSLKK